MLLGDTRLPVHTFYSTPNSACTLTPTPLFWGESEPQIDVNLFVHHVRKVVLSSDSRTTYFISWIFLTFCCTYLFSLTSINLSPNKDLNLLIVTCCLLSSVFLMVVRSELYILFLKCNTIYRLNLDFWLGRLARIGECVLK